MTLVLTVYHLPLVACFITGCLTSAETRYVTRLTGYEYVVGKGEMKLRLFHNRLLPGMSIGIQGSTDKSSATEYVARRLCLKMEWSGAESLGDQMTEWFWVRLRSRLVFRFLEVSVSASIFCSPAHTVSNFHPFTGRV